MVYLLPRHGRDKFEYTQLYTQDIEDVQWRCALHCGSVAGCRRGLWCFYCYKSNHLFM